MASGDVIYDQSDFSVYTNNESTQKNSVLFNKGGTSSNTRQEILFDKFLSSPASSAFDITKTYQIIIKEM